MEDAFGTLKKGRKRELVKWKKYYRGDCEEVGNLRSYA